MVTHEQWVHAGDKVTVAKDWAVTAVFVLAAAVVGSALGSFAFLYILETIGRLT